MKPKHNYSAANMRWVGAHEASGDHAPSASDDNIVGTTIWRTTSVESAAPEVTGRTEHHLRVVLHTSPDLVFVTDRGCILWISFMRSHPPHIAADGLQVRFIFLNVSLSPVLCLGSIFSSCTSSTSSVGISALAASRRCHASAPGPLVSLCIAIGSHSCWSYP